MGQTFKIKTSLYVSANSAQSAGVGAMYDQLVRDGWTVLLSDCTPGPAGLTNAFGVLAEWQPYEVWIQRPGANQAAAEKEVKDAIQATGNWSMAGWAGATVQVVADATAAVAKAAGTGAQKIAEDPTAAFHALDFLSIAVVALVGAYVVYRLAPLVRKG